MSPVPERDGVFATHRAPELEMLGAAPGIVQPHVKPGRRCAVPVGREELHGAPAVRVVPAIVEVATPHRALHLARTAREKHPRTIAQIRQIQLRKDAPAHAPIPGAVVHAEGPADGALAGVERGGRLHGQTCQCGLGWGGPQESEIAVRLSQTRFAPALGGRACPFLPA